MGLAGFDSSPMWIRNRFDLTNSFVEEPDYLRGHEAEFDEHDYQVNLRNWTIPFGRKFRAIRVWLTMKVSFMLFKNTALRTKFDREKIYLNKVGFSGS